MMNELLHEIRELRLIGLQFTSRLSDFSLLSVHLADNTKWIIVTNTPTPDDAK